MKETTSRFWIFIDIFTRRSFHWKSIILKRISEYFSKMKAGFESLRNRLQSKYCFRWNLSAHSIRVRNNQKLYLEIVCQKEEMEDTLKKIENMSISFQQTQKNLREKQAKTHFSYFLKALKALINGKVDSCLKIASNRTMNLIPNLPVLEDQLSQLTVKFDEMKSRVAAVNE